MTVRATALSSLLCLLAVGGVPCVAAPAAQAQAASVQQPRFEAGRTVTLTAQGQSRTVLSAPLDLKVGHLYRVSAKVKVQGVKVDPEARYPTGLGACLSMKQMPFTQASAGLAGDQEGRLELLFFAASAKDQVQLHLGHNAKAWGKATFQDIQVEKVEDVRAYVPLEGVKWSGPGFRYEDGGWTFIHVEGDPYPRGYQYGELVAADIPRFIEKLGLGHDSKDAMEGWQAMRAQVDALFLRKYDVEFLEEMKGIADGAAAAGATVRGRPVDLLDIVTMNSAIDLDYVGSALRVTGTPLTGRTFSKAEDQAAVAPERDKCSSFVATGSATVDGRPVITQMFMWGGYTGVEWRMIVDIKPTRGQRLVYQTFPGGIHSGTDWYMNQAGIVIGETTVGQTPFDPEGTPQSNRIRRAAQYADSIDAFRDLFRKGNNGLYTNEWVLADMKTGEGADYLLGTKREKLWRTGRPGVAADTPGGLKDFIWANNNNRSLEVRSEMAQLSDEAPVDLAFNTWNRDIAFWQFYQQYGKGQIDLDKAVRALASSPINRPHACDGKVTTGEMADQMMFMAHFGKTTHREKMVGSRWISGSLPNATPHLTEGYTTFSPLWVTAKLQALRGTKAVEAPAPAKPELGPLKATYAFEKAAFWKGTVIPATERDFWFSSADAAYHGMLKRMPAAPDKAFEGLRDALADQAHRYLYFAAREGAEAPAQTPVRYDRYGAYQLPRVKGTFLLHQLRLMLGNASFAKVMGEVHRTYVGKPMGTAEFIQTASQAAGKDLAPFIRQWVERTDLPDPKVSAKVEAKGEGFEAVLKVTQAGQPWHLLGSVEVVTAKGSRLEKVELTGPETVLRLASKDKPLKVRFNAGHDFLVAQPQFATLANLSDRFEDVMVVWGSAQSPEAGRTLGLGFQEALAESTAEIMVPLKSDGEVGAQDLGSHDLVVLGGAAQNRLTARLAAEGRLPKGLELGRGWFRWQGRTYGRAEDGMVLCIANPWNPKHNLTLFVANSRLQLWHMTRALPRGIPAWATWSGADVTAKGYHGREDFELTLN